MPNDEGNMVNKEQVLLLADGDWGNLSVLRGQVEEHLPEFLIRTASNASEAFEISRLNSVICSLVALDLPGMGGIEFSRHISNQKQEAFPVILLGASPLSPELRTECLHAGAIDLLARPIDPAELNARLNLVMRINDCHRKTSIYEFMVNSVANPISILDQDLRYEAVNDAWRNLFGLKWEAVLGKCIKDIVGEAYFEKHLRQPFSKCPLGGKYRFELITDKFLGIPATYEVTIVRIPGDRKGQSRMVISTYDVTNFRSVEAGLQDTRAELESLNAKLEAEVEQRVAEIKAAHKALSKSEKLNQSIARISADAILSIDAEGIVHGWNPAAERIFGYKASEILKQSVYILIPDELKAAFGASMRRLNRKREATLTSRAIEIHAIRKNGQAFPVELSISINESEGNRYYTVIVRDVTLRKESEEALSQSTALLAAVGKLAKVGGWELDPDSLEITWTRQTYRIHEIPLGRKPKLDDLISYYHPDDQPLLMAAIKRALEKGKQYDLNVRFITARGTEIWTRAIGKPVIEKGKVVKLLGTVQDISEQKAIEIELKQHREHLEELVEERSGELYKFARAVEESPVSIIMTDVNGNIEYANENFLKTTGYAKQEVLGQTPSFLKSGAHPDEFYKELWETISSGKEWSGIICNRRKNGELYWEQASISPVWDDMGRISNYVAIKDDITEQRLKDEEIWRTGMLVGQALEMTNSTYWTVELSETDVLVSSDKLTSLVGVPKRTACRYSLKEDLFPGMMAADETIAMEVRERYYEFLQDATERFGATFPFKRPDNGKLEWVRLLADLELDDEGTPRMMYGFLMVITEQVKQEQEILEAHDQLEVLFRNMPNGFAEHEMIYDASGKPVDYRYLSINPAFSRLSGLPPDIVGKTIREISPGSQSIWIERLSKVVETGESAIFEHFSPKLGRHFRVNAFSTQKGYFAVLLDDITKRKEQEERIFVNEERLTQIVQGDGLGMFELDIETMHIYVTDLWLKLTGIPGDLNNDLIVNRWFSNVHPDHIKRIRDRVDLMIRQKDNTIHRIAHRYSHPEKGEIWLMTSGRVVDRKEDGSGGRIIGYVQDITERKRDEARIIEAKEAAEAATKAKSIFLANMSHEIRTPMNALMGLAHLALKTELTDQQRNYLEKISGASNSLLEIINDILDFSKIEANRVDLESIPFKLEDVTKQLVDVFSMKALEKGLTLFIDLSPEIPELIVGDPLRLRQVLSNLVSNSLKFTSDGIISVGADVISRENDMIVLEFTITDTGVGMTHEQTSRIFDTFSQADDSTTRRYGGTGLGLSICQRLVELMGGEINVSSTLGEGSVFSFTITVGLAGEATQLAAPTVVTDAPVPDLEGVRILLAEDNPINQEVALGLLEDTRAQVVVAENGLEALDILMKGSFDMVLMDVQMPEMDGLEATRRIRKGDAGDGAKAIPVIAMTASALKEDKNRALKSGMNDHIPKPIEPDQLYYTLANWLHPENGDSESRD